MLYTKGDVRHIVVMYSPVGQVLAPAFTIRGSRTWRVVGLVSDLPLHDDDEGRSQGPSLPGYQVGVFFMLRWYSLIFVLLLWIVPAGSAQIINGGFDTDLTGWTTSTGVSFDTLGGNGIALFNEDPSRTMPVFIEQTFTLSAGQDSLTFEFGARDAFLADSGLTPPGVFAVFLFDAAGQPLGTTDYEFGIHDAVFLRDFDTKSHFGSPLPFDSVCFSDRELLTMTIDLSSLVEGMNYTLKFGVFDGGGGILETYLDNVAVLDTDSEADPTVRLSEDFEGHTPGPWRPDACDAWGAEWTEFTANGIDGISVRNVETTWEQGNWAGFSELFIPMFGRIEFDVVCTVPFNFYTIDTVVKFQPDGSLALFDYAPAVFSWVQTPSAIWTPGQPLRFAVETYADHRDIYVNGVLLLSGTKDDFVQGVEVDRFLFRYGNVSGDSSNTFGPGSLMIDNVLVTRRVSGPETIPAIGDIGVVVLVMLFLASGTLIINRRQRLCAIYEHVPNAPNSMKSHESLCE